jgi:hypothetical protein
LQQAQVCNANLTNAIGLLARQLAAADLAGARLPTTLQHFAGLASVRDLAQQARWLWLLLFVGCALSWLIIASTTDAALLTNAPAALLPYLHTPIPSESFYKVMPCVLLGLYLYFHIYLLRLWEEFADLPAIFPDGRPLDRAAYPWLLHGLVRVYCWRLRHIRPALSRVQTGLAILLAWWMVPLTLMLFWGGYLSNHDWPVTTVHVTLLVAAIGSAVLFQGLARTLLRGRVVRPYTHGAVALVLAFAIDVVLSLLSFGALTGVPSHLSPQLQAPPRAATHTAVDDLRRLVPRLFAFIGCSPFANLAEMDVSTRLFPPTAQQDESLSQVVGAHLSSRNLRYANAVRAFLVKADLRGADLSHADLRYADLRGAQFDGATLYSANFQGADLMHATGLTSEQLATALTDTTTRLPPSLIQPVR